jgi:hypothetical protein
MTKDERKYLGRVAELGCAVCRRMGYEGTPAEIHHRKGGMGIGQRSQHDQAIPLCPEHHRGATGVHGLGVRGFRKHWNYGEEELLEDVKSALNNSLQNSS